MKRLLLAIFGTLLSFSTASAASLNCTSDPGDNNHRNSGVVVVDHLAGDCVNDEDGTRFFVSMSGGGIALRHGSITKFIIACNTPKDEIAGEYVGGKLNVALFLGLTGGMYYFSEKKVICTVGGIGYEFGASVSAGKMVLQQID